MIKQVISDTKTVFGNEESVSYSLEKHDDLISFIEENANEWRENQTLVVLDENALGVLMVSAYDYDITYAGVCEFYLDPLKEDVITIKRMEDSNKFMLETVVTRNNNYSYVPYQAFASSVTIGKNMQEKIKGRNRG